MVQGRRTSILLIDDDDDLRRELALQLEAQGDLAVEEAVDGRTGLAAVAAGSPALVLLDVTLPDMDGRDVCRAMRAEGVKAPIVMLTSLGAPEDAVSGLDSGANDFVTKPFNLNVLIARIRAHLRSHQASEDAIFAIGPYEFRPAQKVLVTADGGRLRLTDKETSILKYLFRSGEKAVGREELLREVWGYRATVTTHTLETHIYRLRQKIEPDAQSPRLLITETGGYRLQP
jgi:DNA-binding response OmpR family regulator